jgi:hypothetical protein
LAPIQNSALQGNNAIAGALTEVENNIGGIAQTVSVPFISSLILNYNDNIDSSRAQAEALTVLSVSKHNWRKTLWAAPLARSFRGA